MPQVQPASPEPRAMAVARQLRNAINAECVILFGSRARSDWRDHSDTDLIIITCAEQNGEQVRTARKITQEIIKKNCGKSLNFDQVFLTPGQYELKSRHTLEPRSQSPTE